MTDIVGRADFAARWTESAWLFHSLTENLDQCVYLLDHEGRCLAANTAFARWLDRPLAEIVGRGVAELWPSAVAERDAAEHKRILQGERIDRTEGRPRREQSLRVRLRKAPLRDDDGVVRGVLCLFEEVASEAACLLSMQSPSMAGAPAYFDKTILLVEPDVNLILLTTRMLTPHALHVMAVREGRLAVQVYRQYQTDIDLLIVEQNLPGTSGLETMNDLLSINARLRILLLSGTGKPQSSLWENMPSVGFLSKPYTQDQIVQAVRGLLSGEMNKEA